MTELNFDTIVELLKERDIPAIVEQTGGGTATIYAGEMYKRREPVYTWKTGPRTVDRWEDVDRWEAGAGPGYFEGPGWTNGRGGTEDFVVGRDDDGEGEYVYADDTWDEKRAADEITKVVETVRKERGR